MEHLVQDLSFALRLLWKRRTLSAIALLTLALGIGATGSIFSVVRGVLLRPLPFESADRLVAIWETNPKLRLGFDELPVSAANLVHWQTQSQGIAHITGIRAVTVNIVGMDEPVRLEGVQVSASFFPLLGARAERGRIFSAEEDSPEAGRVAVISHDLWRRQFSGDPGIIGKTITLNDEPYTVVGIMPASFQFPRAADLPMAQAFPSQIDLWLPLALSPEEKGDRGTHNMAVLGRLRDATSLSQAQADMDAIARAQAEAFPESKDWGIQVIGLHEYMTKEIKPALVILLAAVGFVLLVVCVNLANLQLARALARQKEIALRMILGAGPRRVAKQLLTESLLLALIGGMLGLGLSFVGLEILLRLISAELPQAEQIEVDAAVVGFVALITLMSGVAFGLAPLGLVFEQKLGEAVKEGSAQGTGGRKTGRLRTLLVVIQIALAFTLSTGAALLVSSFIRLLQVDPGFEPKEVLTAQIVLPSSRYPEPAKEIEFFDRMLERLQVLPGVESVGITSQLPLAGAEEIARFTIEGRPAMSSEEAPYADTRSVSPAFFQTMKIPLAKGRFFTEEDHAKAPRVVIISEEMARRYFPGEDPIGKQIKLGSDKSRAPWMSIVGLVGNVRNSALDAEPRAQMYMPYRQYSWPEMTVVMRTGPQPLRMAKALREAVWEADRDQPVSRLVVMEEYVDASIARQRSSTTLVSIFAVLAVVLAAVGIYGVMAYAAGQRTKELGIRMALGAKPSEIAMLLMKYAGLMTLIGVAIGLVGAFLARQLLAPALYQTTPMDPVMLIIAALLVAAVTLVAGYLPARRVARLEPINALQHGS